MRIFAPRTEKVHTHSIHFLQHAIINIALIIPKHYQQRLLPETTEVGMKASAYYGLESDYVIEVDITPNRADACSHYGVARDLAAWMAVNTDNKPLLTRRSVESYKVDRPDAKGVEVGDMNITPFDAADINTEDAAVVSASDDIDNIDWLMPSPPSAPEEKPEEQPEREERRQPANDIGAAQMSLFGD